MSALQMLLTIGAAGLATVLTRSLPFLVFPAGQETPRFVRFLGDALPGAVFGLLVVYCLREVDPLAGSHGIPEALGILVAGGLYLWRRNMLLSIFASTALYMVLVNLVFV
ncbi:branched-chain amino acid transporter permease [Collinsella sp. An2]|uniref:branched-chain amino acid transporter permease n=1 Tax=Collinsella sp. An2 TaxID=1965585 RepID=UPI001EF6578C|nr:branched-chain amino acid transporter permease [Collinsella sp. An2]